MNLNFGQALETLKQGKKVTRQGWNGKGMYLFQFDRSWASFPEQLEAGYPVESSTCIKTAQDTIVMGWKPSQTDMLAEDWVIIN